jgi:hypothetical protein
VGAIVDNSCMEPDSDPPDMNTGGNKHPEFGSRLVFVRISTREPNHGQEKHPRRSPKSKVWEGVCLEGRGK